MWLSCRASISEYALAWAIGFAINRFILARVLLTICWAAKLSRSIGSQPFIVRSWVRIFQLLGTVLKEKAKTWEKRQGKAQIEKCVQMWLRLISTITSRRIWTGASCSASWPRRPEVRVPRHPDRPIRFENFEAVWRRQAGSRAQRGACRDTSEARGRKFEPSSGGWSPCVRSTSPGWTCLRDKQGWA